MRTKLEDFRSEENLWGVLRFVRRRWRVTASSTGRVSIDARRYVGLFFTLGFRIQTFKKSRFPVSLHQPPSLTTHKKQEAKVTMLNLTAAASRSKALSLYRQLLRGAEKMPTPNRRKYVIKKTRECLVVWSHSRDEMEQMTRRPSCLRSPNADNCRLFLFLLLLLLLLPCVYVCVGTEFKANIGLTDPKEIEFCIRLADTNLDTV
jgi:Complex 1 protein (LYR family)